MKKSGLKICTIGGGSSYTPEIIEGFIKKKNEGKLPITDLYLVDVESGKEKLEIIGDLAWRMVQEANADINIHTTMDRREALKDADYVTTQFRVGQLESRILDEKIPLKYDLIGQETNGAGGFMKAMRTIPVILDICRDMEELCPDAWLVNFTNPSGMITETVLKYAKNIKVVGLCNVPIGIVNKIAKLFDVDSKRVTVEFAGINHFVFGQYVYIDGVDRTEEVIEKMIKGTEISMKNIPNFEFPEEILRSIKAIPAGYLKYYYTRDKMLKDCHRAAKEEGTRGEVVREIEEDLFEMYKDANLVVKPKELELRGGAYYSEAAVNLIDSLHNGDGEIHYVNIRNNGAISDLPDNAAIEVNCRVTEWDAKPLNVGPMKDTMLKGHLQLMKAFEELTIEAGVEGNYLKAIQALTINPLVNDYDKAKNVLDDMLVQNEEYLPQFKEEIAKLKR